MQTHDTDFKVIIATGTSGRTFWPSGVPAPLIGDHFSAFGADGVTQRYVVTSRFWSIEPAKGSEKQVATLTVQGEVEHPMPEHPYPN